MKSMLSRIDYVIECRDFRVPVTSINPMFEEALGDKQRLIVYTKRDLGGGRNGETRKVVMTIYFDTVQNADKRIGIE